MSKYAATASLAWLLTTAIAWALSDLYVADVSREYTEWLPSNEVRATYVGVCAAAVAVVLMGICEGFFWAYDKWRGR